MKYRLLAVLFIIGLVAAYIGQAIGHSLLWCMLIRHEQTFASAMLVYCLPVGWWVDVGIANLICWIFTGHHIAVGEIFNNIFKWLEKKIDGEENRIVVKRKNKIKQLKRKMVDMEYENALKELNKEFPGLEI